MEKQDLKESVCCNLRSVTQSCKGGVPLSRLERDYQDLIGSRIPFRDLGFNSLENFARSIPNVIRLTKGREGSLMAEAVADSSTAHIASLISRQKQTGSKRGSKRPHFAQRRGGFSQKYVSRVDRNPYGSYSATKSSGRSYKQDFKSSSTFSHSKTSPPSYKVSPAYNNSRPSPAYNNSRPSPAYNNSRPSPNFKIEIKNTNPIPRERSPSPVAAPEPSRKPKPFSVGGYEIAPRFQRLLQRKVEAAQEQRRSETPASDSQSTRSTSVTPPKTPTPPLTPLSRAPSSPRNPYAFSASSIASANSSRTSPTEENWDVPAPRSVVPQASSSRTSHAKENWDAPRSVPQASSSRTSHAKENWDVPAPRSVPQASSSAAHGESSNGYSYTQPRSLRPLSAKLNVAVTAKQQLDAAETSKEYVEIYAKMNNLSVNYSIKVKGQNKYCNLHLGEKSYLSYPKDAYTAEDAEELAADEAVKFIKATLDAIEKSQALPETPISNAEEIQILLNRIEELVCEKPSGIFINGLGDEYQQLFEENLPSCWVELLKQSSVLEIDEIEVTRGKVPEGANFIVRPSRGFSSGSTTPSESSGKVYQELQDAESDEPVPEKDFTNDLVPPLMIPTGNEWNVYITGVYTTESSHLLAATFIDYDEEFKELLKKMSIYYNNTIDPVVKVEEKHLYATIEGQTKRELIIHRVLASKILDDDMVECYFVDLGTVDVVRKLDLQHLPIDFLEMPYQAIHFALDGLEDYVPFTMAEHLECLKYESLIAVVKRWCSEDFFLDDPGIHKVIYSVILYDTSDPAVNFCVHDTVKKNVSQSLLPKLNKTSQGYLTHVTSIGHVYVRFLHPVKSWLEIELEGLYQSFEEACLENGLYTPSDEIDEIFVAKCTFDNKWYRAVVPEHPNVPKDPEMMEVVFVDYGYPCFVKKSEICDLTIISDFLSSLPYQVVKCELNNAIPSDDCKWTIAATQRLLEMAPFKEELIIRVISEGESGALPKISLHKRIYTEADSFIISINENLASNPELFLDLSVASTNGTVKAPSKLNLQSTAQLSPSVTSPVENSAKAFFRNVDAASPDGIEWITTPDMVKSPEEEDLSPPPLTQPEVPEIGEFFDVYVTTAANPSNFIVQPLKSADALNDLGKHMHQFYSVEENLIEMHPSLLQRNSFYAAFHSLHNTWYRVRLVSFNKNAPDGALVHYVDYGDFDQVNIQNLQKLYNQFRALPCQAIKASLSGVKPIDIDWNPEHCVQFKGMVTEKEFVSVVQKKYLSEEQGFPYLKLDLILIDTKIKGVDTFIGDELIAKSMALKTAF